MKRPSNEPIEKTPTRRSKRVKVTQSSHIDSDIDEEISYTNSPASKETSEPVEEKSVFNKKGRKSRNIRDNSQDSGCSGKNIQLNDTSNNDSIARRKSTRGRKSKNISGEQATFASSSKDKSLSTTSMDDDNSIDQNNIPLLETTSKEVIHEEEKTERMSVEKEEVEDDDESTNTESSDEESIDFSKIETVAKGRPRRANAGNRMELLLTKEEKELMAEEPPEYQDYFYRKEDNTVPEGENDLFSEKDIDDSGDEIDSDFLDSDKTDDEANGDEAEKSILAIEREEKRRLKRKYKSTVLDIPISAYNVQPNVLTPEEHEKALEKSVKTAEQNIASLQKYQAMEIENKNKRFNKNKKKMRPMDVDIIIKKGDERLLHLAVEPIHNVPKKGERLICAISGKPAKYFDPLTEIPYYSIEEFKIIRKMYEEYLNSVEVDLRNLKVSKNVDC
ncbi:YL1 nuclear family and YL1 nuclear, C-terminal domain-containing protein [Strongyloides ratti]|uniref:Vacuolar protein sorting-associated protein 72 homolog n=1 Tax=Strongyloides ratti TaxID=34506 RepID=A0A090LBV7_STRRB|nr:YL1 nuclear family and YL1 nuclear, C-terminal domain-containing protein [Strongyloides ratti]CEF67251.1 YL1 nuclear family and YL1 nuclear, C-terminal domain-containing protein [Strongyloides ratti]